jgi:hypothetical protein
MAAFHAPEAGLAIGLAAGLLVGRLNLVARIGSWIIIGAALPGLGAFTID